MSSVVDVSWLRLRNKLPTQFFATKLLNFYQKADLAGIESESYRTTVADVTETEHVVSFVVCY